MKNNLTLDALIKKKEQLEARIQNIKAREAMQQRKDETRRKILVGSYILDKHQKAGSLEKLFSELDKFLFKPYDRELFGLEPRKEEKVPASSPESAREKYD
jgi:large subunit ribosomal protein L7/L12